MAWYIYSILAALSFSGMILSVRILTDKGFSSKQILFFLCGFVFLGFLIVNLFFPGNVWSSDSFPLFLKVMVIAGIFAAIGNWADFEGVKRSPNPGYSMAIRNTAILPVTVLSAWLFSSDFNVFKFVGAITIILGITSLILKNKSSAEEKTKSSFWQLFALAALFAFTITILGIKKATLIPSVSLTEINLLIFAFNLLFFSFVCRKEFKSYFADKSKLKSFLPVVFLASAFSFFGNILAIKGLSAAPNPGYNEAIKNTNMLFTTILSVKLFSANLDKFKIFGVALITIGVIILIF